MDTRRIFHLTAALIALGSIALAFSQATARQDRHHGRPIQDFDGVIRDFSRAELEKGRQVFRYDTFGDEAWWGGVLQLHKALEGANHGGVGPRREPGDCARRRPQG